MNFQDIQTVAQKTWPFDESSYPALAHLSIEDRQTFALKHVLTHLTKAVGRVASAVEPLDHGERLNKETIRIALRKVIVDAVQGAGIAGITSKELEEEIARWQNEPDKE